MTRQRSRPLTVLLVVVTAWLLAVPATAAPGGVPRAPITVMTRNLYLGADLMPVLTAASGTELVTAAAAVYQQVGANDFPERAQAIAAEIAEAGVDVVGLQEVALWRTGPLGDPAPAETVVVDYLAELQAALAERGLRYDVASTVRNFDGEVPTALGFDVRYTDHDVILVRRGVRVVDAASGSFDATLSFASPTLGEVTVDRGWTSVDVRHGRATYRVVNTHLEAFGPDLLRSAQTLELLAGPLATDLPTTLVGDLNAPPTSQPLALLATAGFADAWQGPGGVTCCFPADLHDPGSLTQRIDYVLHRGWASVDHVEVVGDEPGDRTPSGLWPSDHAGVTATMRLA